MLSVLLVYCWITLKFVAYVHIINSYAYAKAESCRLNSIFKYQLANGIFNFRERVSEIFQMYNKHIMHIV